MTTSTGAEVTPREATTDDAVDIAASAAEKRAAGRQALTDLLEPVSGRITLAKTFAVLAGVLAVAPYVALVRLGEVLLTAHAAGTTPDPDRVHQITMWLIGTFLAQLGMYLLALAITHFADLKLNQVLRERIVDRISRAPLSWFTDTNSGRVRKAV